MLDIPTISALVAAGGVIVGVVFASLEMRNLVRTRKTELLHGLYSSFSSSEYLEAWEKFRDRKIMGYTEYKEKYGMVEVNMIARSYSELAILTCLKLIDINVVYPLFHNGVKMVWERLKPITEELRKIRNSPDIDWEIEYVYNEMQKREQRLQQTQQ